MKETPKELINLQFEGLVLQPYAEEEYSGFVKTDGLDSQGVAFLREAIILDNSIPKADNRDFWDNLPEGRFVTDLCSQVNEALLNLNPEHRVRVRILIEELPD